MKPLEERFLAKVNKTNTCWLWAAYKDKKGYGRFSYKRADGVQRMITAHRVAYTLYKGHIPKDLFVCHTCDNPPCVNPDHLFLGTNDDNVKDKMKKGRHVAAGTHCGKAAISGENNSQARLTELVIRKIRVTAKHSKTSYKALGKMYGVSFQQISDIVRCKRWKHLPGIPCDKRTVEGENNGHAKLTELQVRKIRVLWKHCGISQAVLARKYGVWGQQISRIVNRRTWAHLK